MKKRYWYLVAIAVLLLAVVCAGCSSVKSGDTGKTSSESTGTSSSAGSAAATTVASGSSSCPAVTSATSWTGKWTSWGNSDLCFDGRVYFYPPTTDNPDPWSDRWGGDWDFPVTFTQTGCDVTGSITVGENGQITAPQGCPITLTGKVDSTGAASGTWKAYCNVEFQGDQNSTDSGVWNLNMEPGGSTFIGTFGTTDSDITSHKANSCPSANSNWAGKRA